MLVEVHNETELEAALALNPPLVGINNRDLTTLEVSLETSLRLRPLIPDTVTVVCESGIGSAEDVRRMLAGGLNAFLVGTSLMKAENPGRALADLIGGGCGQG